MLKRVWDGTVSLWVTIAICSFLLFVTALGFMSARAYDRATQDYQTSRAYDETRRQFEQRCAGLEGKETFDCLKEQIDTAREPSRSEEDVGAQKEMARWALWMLVVSGVVGIATIGVTGVGLYFIRDTLETARQANELMRADKRPWIKFHCGPNGAFDVFGVRDTQVKLEIKAEVENIGEKPATDFIQHTKVIDAGFLYAKRRAIDAFVSEIFGRQEHLGKGQVIYPTDPLETHHTMHTVVRQWSKPPKDNAFEEGRFLIYCVTYRGVGFMTYFHNAQIYQIRRFGPESDGWELLRFGDAQSIN
ncbi:MAG: hypothetical protein EOS17_08855 [Mesorhizobium sp.]|nr:MAG: hypothetical protein EOS17_08855 [Mesorhizobium sp.]